MTGLPAVGDEARPPGEARLPYRQRWAWTLQMNRPMASPFIGFVCAVSIGGPLAVGIATGYPRAGGWAAVTVAPHPATFSWSICCSFSSAVPSRTPHSIS